MASWDCPSCNTRTQFNRTGGEFSGANTGVPTGEVMTFATCTNCGYLLTAFLPVGEDRILRSLPAPKDVVVLSGAIPPSVQADLREASLAQSVGACKSSAVMCRRALQGAAIQLGATPRKRLVDQIDELRERGKITDGLRDLAHKLRIFGNDGAHPGDDGLDAVTSEESALALDFARSFVRYVYELPAQVAAMDALATVPPDGAVTDHGDDSGVA